MTPSAFERLLPMVVARLEAAPDAVKGPFLDALLQMLVSAMSNPAIQAQILALILKLFGGGA